MRVTVVRVMAGDDIQACYDVYAAAAGRDTPALREFAAAMTDRRLEKFVVRDSAGAPLALTTLTDISGAPARLGGDFRASRHRAHGTVFFLGRTLVRPGCRSPEVFQAMRDAVIARLATPPAPRRSLQRRAPSALAAQ